MNPIFDSFLFPVSPIAALVVGAMLLIGAECIPALKMPRVKLGLAALSAGAALFFSILLWKAGPLAAAAPSEIRWLGEFVKMYRLDGISITFFATIAAFTLISIVLVDLEFHASDIRSEILALVLFISAGMMLLVSANNLIMVFLGLELMSLPTYVLVGIKRTDRNSTEAALKYFLFGSFATVLLVFGIALVYAQVGSLTVPVVAERVAQMASPSGPGTNALLIAGMVLILVAAAFKVGVAPFHMWVPDAYQGAPSSITGFMGSAIKVAGFGLAARLLWVMFLPLIQQWVEVLGTLAVLTMFVGNLAALVQDNLKRLFAYSSISHAGFLLLGICTMASSPSNASVLLYYLVVYGLMFLGLFAIVAMLERQSKSTDIYMLSGMGFSQPLTSLALAFFALSAAGIPPTAGFFAKYFIFFEAVQAGRMTWVILALLSSLIGVYYYLRVLVYLYMKESKETVSLASPQHRLAYLCVAACLVVLIYFSVMPSSLSMVK